MFKVAGQAQRASYLLADVTAEEMKSHPFGETFIFPACAAIEEQCLVLTLKNK
jgi:hypothetical protein